ncbi:hypothetical protein [Dyella mobilis]|uniref:Restriction endonuclease n=1 Tax=Dyella mobilis TaxID=1849582 RepID=A0ABS2KIK9_9GAMM|nr:hypothetical protein [Dyella mobilis]MBM7130991.1 hypothetical protein [Dyella mobilis]GLQ97619.1 hypothetical protein GCM10007863_20390 [Dyella mobilis]
MTSSKDKPILRDFKSVMAFLEKKKPIEAAFELAIDGLAQRLTVEADEESITSAFLGGVISNYPWCALLSSMDDDGLKKCSWAHYKKSGSGVDAEPQSGADFALVMHRDNFVHVAVFQAKKGHRVNEKYAVDVHRKREKEGTSFIQIVALKEASEKLAKIALGRDIEPADLGWVHYLCYYQGKVECVQLSKLEDVVEDAKTNTQSYMDVFLEERAARPWIKVLMEGMSNGPVDGWLRMNLTVAEKNLPTLLPLMNVIIVEEGRGGRSLKLPSGEKVFDRSINRRGIKQGFEKKFSKVEHPDSQGKEKSDKTQGKSTAPATRKNP